MSIKHWHEDDRPREKLLKQGASALSDAELLAIFLRTGTKDLSAIALARGLIEHFGSLAEVLAAPPSEVLAQHGMGSAKYAQLLASLEMATRYLDSQLRQGQRLNQSKLVKDYVATQLRRESNEVFAVLCLDSALSLIQYEVLFVGGLSSCGVCVRQVLRHAISHAAAQLIIAHNHPLTDAMPSAHDDLLTQQLYEACRLVDITLVDHVIVGRNAVFSYAEQGRAPF